MKDNNEILEHRIRRAIETTTPDLLPQILQSIEAKKGGTKMDAINTQEIPQTFKNTIKQKKAISTWIKWSASIAAVFMIAFTTYFVNSYYTPQSTIAFDINPSIELKVNKSEKVLDVIPLNKEAQIVIGDMKLKKVDLDTAVNALVGSMVKNGYINEIKNSILISVDSKNEQKGTQLQERLSTEIDILLNGYSVEGAVLAQTVKEDEHIKELANKYDISFGKAALIDLVVNQENNLRYDDLANLSINDINLLINSQHANPQGVSTSGKASSREYIGEDRAKSIALSHANTDGSIAKSIRVKMDYDNGKMVYDVDFYVNSTEYEYEIDAINGSILKFEHDDDDDHDRKVSPNNKPSNGKKDNKNDKQYIGKKSAKNIAFKHANVVQSSVKKLKIKLDDDFGRMIYEIEFDSGNIEYEYDIDAYTGEILEYEHDDDDHHDRKVSSNKPSNVGSISSNSNTSAEGNKNTNQYISKESAKNIAFKHANVVESSVKDLEMKLDEDDDDRMIYEIEFDAGDMEYEYDIDATTGKILDWKHDD